MSKLIGIDTGGTFTDFIVYENGKFATLKILSTPSAPEQAILQGLKQFGMFGEQYSLVHGTTVATNVLLEGKGARTAFITNQGIKDLLQIGRQTRTDLYSLCPGPSHDLFDAGLCFETSGRVSADGRTVSYTRPQEIEVLRRALHAKKVEAVAICSLFAFLDDTDEKAMAEQLSADFFVSSSSQILPEQREYERAVVTWLNSYLGPVTRRYLINLQSEINGQQINVMQSDATTLPAMLAAQRSVRLLLSGPAGGVAAAVAIAEQVSKPRLLTLDMGGTSTDVALIDGQASMATETYLAGLPIAIPMLDIHTIGAGGGSIARVDKAQVLHVGPESAGANPGPACFDGSGTLATITDANVVLGRLPERISSSFGLKVNKQAAIDAVRKIAEQLGCGLAEAAQGIISLANAHMAQALRVISIQRGYDPADFSLFPFGGSGTLHMCAVAQELGIHSILIPKNAGVLSAFGMLFAPLGTSASRSICRPIDQLSLHQMKIQVQQLQAQTCKQLAEQNISPDIMVCRLELRYLGQSSKLLVDWRDDFAQVKKSFSQQYQQQFGFQLPHYPIEVVTIRVWAQQTGSSPVLPDIAAGEPAAAISTTKIAGYQQPVKMFVRDDFVRNQRISGPCIILDEVGTVFVAHHWGGFVDRYGHIHLQLDTGHL